MTKRKLLSEVLQEFMFHARRSVADLSELTKEIFGERHQVNKKSISRWASGRVKRPHLWQELVRVAVALELSRNQADELLVAADHPSVSRLERTTQSLDDQELLAMIPRAPFQAPRDVSIFVGRETKLRRIESEVQKGSAKVYCLIGMGGVGKTSLALQVAYRFRDQFPDGVLWADMNDKDPMNILHNFAEVFDVDVSEHYPDLSSRSAKVRSLLATKHALIVLNNVESDDEVRWLLPPTGHCTVIITTRHRDLAIADTAERIMIEPFDPNQETALTLFGRILNDEAWVLRDKILFREMADLLGHLPLAIHIIAHRLKYDKPAWSAAEMLQALRGEEKRLSQLVRGDQNVTLSFNLTYNALEKMQQRFFASLTLFTGEGFTVKSVAYVAEYPVDAARDLLRHLHNLSLLQQGHHERYRLHPLIREYGQLKLIEQAPIERFINYFVEYVIAHKDDYEALDQELKNIIHALELAAKQQKELLVQGVIGLYSYLKVRGLYEHAQEFLGKAQQAAEAFEDRRSQAELMGYQAEISRRQGQSQKAVDLYQKALELARKESDAADLNLASRLLAGLGALAFRNGRLQEAKNYYTEAMLLAKSSKDEARQIMLTTNLGLIAATVGHIQEAETLYEEALNRARLTGSKTSQITALQNLGVLLNEQGEQKRAKECFEEGLALSEELESPELQSRLLGNLGVVANSQGNYREAKQIFQRALSLAEKIGHKQQASRQHTNLGLVESNLRNDRQANMHYQEALTIAREEKWPADISSILVSWGELHLRDLALTEAFGYFEEARQLSKDNHLKKLLGKSLYGLAQVAECKGNAAEARRLGEESKEILDAIGHKRASDVRHWLLGLPSEEHQAE